MNNCVKMKKPKKKKKNETIDAILEEMRDIGVAEFDDFADRIEAAANRERKPGSVFAMRSALMRLEEELKWMNQRGWGDSLAAVRAALAAPPRNCDVGTKDEQHARFKAFCQERNCIKCPFYGVADCEVEWSNTLAERVNE